MGNKAGKHHQKSSGTTTAAAITTTAPQPTVSSTPKPKPIPRKPKAVPTATPPFIPAATIEKNTKSKNTNTKTTKKMEGEGYGPPVNNVCEMIGNTPMIKLSDKMTGTPNVTIYAKAEYCNPLSSVKDRYVGLGLSVHSTRLCTCYLFLPWQRFFRCPFFFFFCLIPNSSSFLISPLINQSINQSNAYTYMHAYMLLLYID